MYTVDTIEMKNIIKGVLQYEKKNCISLRMHNDIIS